MGTALKQRALSSVGRLARRVPNDQAQIFSFVASPAVRADPWALYQRLHRRDPVRSGPYGIWLVASHPEVVRVLRELPTSVDEDQAIGLPAPSSAEESDFSRLMRHTLLFMDPPDHTRLRQLVSRRFTPRRIDALRDPVTDLIERAVADIRPRGTADLVRDLALPFPVAVICELLGLPMGDRDRFIAWARAIAPRLDISVFRDDAVNEAGNRGAREMEAYFHDILDNPDRLDPDGLLVALVAAGDEDDRLERDEVIGLAALLLLAGFETTTNLVANSIHSLFSRPDARAAVGAGDLDMALAVDELLRHDGPVQFSQRVVLEDVELGGHAIPSHSLLALLIGAANRDPLVFDRPDDLVLDRSPNPHLSFSSGIHHCLGAPLARLEASVAIPAILRGLPDLQPAARPRWRDTFVLRGLAELPVRWRT